MERRVELVEHALDTATGSSIVEQSARSFEQFQQGDVLGRLWLARREPELRQSQSDCLGDRLNRSLLEESTGKRAAETIGRRGEISVADWCVAVERGANARNESGVALLGGAAVLALALRRLDKARPGLITNRAQRPDLEIRASYRRSGAFDIAGKGIRQGTRDKIGAPGETEGTGGAPGWRSLAQYKAPRCQPFLYFTYAPAQLRIIGE